VASNIEDVLTNQRLPAAEHYHGPSKGSYIRKEAVTPLKAQFFRAAILYRAGAAVDALEIAGVGGFPKHQPELGSCADGVCFHIFSLHDHARIRKA
jgi:hypothetical protein